MEKIRLKSRAKINLTLDVLGRRENGYHDVSMIMQTVSLFDSVYIKKTGHTGVKIKANLNYLPVDQRNIAFKAAVLLKDVFHIKDGVMIELNKQIPVAAGLAGGSGNAAAVLYGMNHIFDLGLNTKELMEYGNRLGSDVPYCLLRGTALAQGLGERITPLSDCPPFHVVLIKPNFSVSTAAVYTALQMDMVLKRPDNKAMIQNIKTGNQQAIADGLCNVLEAVTIPMYPQIAQIKRVLMEHGAQGALMSGSGPTVFGLFSDKEKAKHVVNKIKKETQWKNVYITTVFNRKRSRRS